ncbi:MAG: phage scaffolding protein [Sedimentisphaerales bacterium]|nr:phage scaffolding protein [Sedimentisphaerales bacterium]
MSQEQQQLNDSSTPAAAETNGTEQVVPVSEAIRYRKRAQASEQQVEQLTAQLQELRREHHQASEQINRMKQDAQLAEQLVRAGVKDLEAATLLAQKRLKAANGETPDLRQVVEQLRTDRPYLFAGNEQADWSWMTPTAGVRTTGQHGRQTLSKLAERARASGQRQDMHEYLRLRRSLRG